MLHNTPPEIGQIDVPHETPKYSKLEVIEAAQKVVQHFEAALPFAASEFADIVDCLLFDVFDILEAPEELPFTDPGFPTLGFCPVAVYTPEDHNPEDCPFCLMDTGVAGVGQ